MSKVRAILAVEGRHSILAAATAILAKIGLEGIDSDYATLVRTTVILVVLAASPLAPLPHPLRPGHGRELGLLLPGAQAGRGLSRRPDRQAERGAGGHLRGGVLGERPALRDWAGIACVAVGVLLLSLKR